MVPVLEDRLVQVVRIPGKERADETWFALAVESVCGSERTYLYSLGSQQGNAHLHWHVAVLPAGVPYEQQQFHAVMGENGVLRVPPEEAADLAGRLHATFDLRLRPTEG